MWRSEKTISYLAPIAILIILGAMSSLGLAIPTQVFAVTVGGDGNVPICPPPRGSLPPFQGGGGDDSSAEPI